MVIKADDRVVFDCDVIFSPGDGDDEDSMQFWAGALLDHLQETVPLDLALAIGCKVGVDFRLLRLCHGAPQPPIVVTLQSRPEAPLVCTARRHNVQGRVLNLVWTALSRLADCRMGATVYGINAIDVITRLPFVLQSRLDPINPETAVYFPPAPKR